MTAPARAEIITSQETIHRQPGNDLAVTKVIVASMQEQLKEAGFYQARVDGHLGPKRVMRSPASSLRAG